MHCKRALRQKRLHATELVHACEPLLRSLRRADAELAFDHAAPESCARTEQLPRCGFHTHKARSVLATTRETSATRAACGATRAGASSSRAPEHVGPQVRLLL